MNKSKAKINQVKQPPRENCVAYKKVKNKCNSLNWEAKKKFCKEATQDG